MIDSMFSSRSKKGNDVCYVQHCTKGLARKTN